MMNLSSNRMDCALFVLTVSLILGFNVVTGFIQTALFKQSNTKRNALFVDFQESIRLEYSVKDVGEAIMKLPLVLSSEISEQLS